MCPLGLVKLMRWMTLLTALTAANLGCVHTQQPRQDVYVISEDASGVGSNIDNGTGGSGAEAYCNELQKQCYKVCWRRKPEYPTIPKHSEKHQEHCSETCLREFMKCVKEQEDLERQDARRETLHFSTVGAAIDWIREHKAEVALGTVVIVGGVIAAPYVVAVMGGTLVLTSL